jgi:gamma-glutamylcyclotransferase (GGCT)/AIG2-like uncharacterized protein YtfP
MTERLFVYGTLAPGRPNEHVLKAVPGSWTPGVVRGDLTQQGWGADLGYPALLLRADGPDVLGLVFTSDELSDLWAELDRFEGPEYERVIVSVALETGETVSAYVYVAKR